MLIINDTLGTYGGSITLIERLCTWAMMNNESIKVYCNDMSNKEIVTKLNRMNVTIECFDTYDSKTLFLHIYEDLKLGDIQIVSFILNNYLSIEAVKKSHDLDFVNVIYSIHPATFYKGTGIKEGAFKSIILKRYKKTVQRINDNGAIVFMDQDNIESTEKYYGFSFNSPTVIRALPMICTPLGEDELRSKISKSYDKKIIFTSCRADFPFKSYVLGLVDAIASINKNNIVAKLTIVSYGKDLDVIKGKIKGKNYIKLIQETKYNDLENIYLDSDIYVGMGSTAIEAAKYGLPVILANVNSPDFLSCGFFCDNPQAIGEFDTDGIDGYKLLTELLKMDRDMFMNLADNCKNVFDNNYDMGLFINHIRGVVKNASN